VADNTLIATFYDEADSSMPYQIGENMNLQDAYNATLNTHFAPTKIVLQEEKNHNTSADMQTEIIETTEKSVSVPLAKIGKHSIEEIKEKHDLTDAELQKLLEEGMQHEFEHTDSPIVALAIAKDHIYEHLNYYKRLEDLKFAKGGLLKHKK
jgi:hypothetical protein